MRLFQKNLLLLLAAVMLIAVTASCSGGSSGSSTPAPTAQETEPPAVQTPVVSVDSDREKAVVKYEGEEGKAEYQVGLEGDVDIPEDYPEDVVPVYPGSLVTLAGFEDDSFMIVASTDDDFGDIFDYYKENIDFSETELLQNMKGYVMLSGTVGDYYANVTVTENVSSEGGANMITIVVTTES